MSAEESCIESTGKIMPHTLLSLWKRNVVTVTCVDYATHGDSPRVLRKV